MSLFKYPKGSEWRRWDLHAHTPLDSEWICKPSLRSEQDKIDFAKTYVEAASNAGLSVLAITDHNFCDHPDQLLLPFIKDEAQNQGITILPGFEVTVSDCGGTHILVIFPEETSFDKIDDIVKQLFPPGTARFIDQNVMPSGKTLNEMVKMLRESQVDHILVFAHADRENGVLSHRGGNVKAALWNTPFIKIAQMSKHPRECSAFYNSIFDGTNADYSRPMAYIICSDCRAIDRHGLPAERNAIGDRFTWIKADPTFEGLRQILFEHESRVAIQDHKPEEKPEIYTISSMRFFSDDKLFPSYPIQFNPNLTAIIGGKSTGKSILLSQLAKTIDINEFDQKTSISKVNTYAFDGLEVMVTWSNGDTNVLTDSSSSRRITYLPQMYINKLVETENRESLSDNILSFLRQNPEFETHYLSMQAEAENKISDISSLVSTLLTTLHSLRQAYRQIKELGEKASLETEIKKIEKRQEQLRTASGFTSEETNAYNVLVHNENNFNRLIGTLSKVLLFSSDFISDLSRLIPDLLSTSDDKKFTLLIQYGLQTSDVMSYLNAYNEFIDSIRSLLESLRQKMARLDAVTTHNMYESQVALDTVKEQMKPFLDKINNKQLLTELDNQLSSLSQTLTILSQRISERNSLVKTYRETFANIRSTLQQHLETKVMLLNTMNYDQYTNVGDDIRIFARVRFDYARFNSQFLDRFDLRSSLSRLGDYFINESLSWSLESHVEIFMSIFSKLLDSSAEQLRLKAGNTSEDTIKALFQDFMNYELSVQQGGEDILSMSPGKQGLILLELFLHLNNSKYPILIDQPEDNLDNRTIYSHLVEYVKNKKRDRQIIMVTHNPNLVVATDAEQVIVANQVGEGESDNQETRFEYVSGGLECSFSSPDAESILASRGIREHVCHILEGGAEAFRKREEKYCLNVR